MKTNVYLFYGECGGKNVCQGGQKPLELFC